MSRFVYVLRTLVHLEVIGEKLQTHVHVLTRLMTITGAKWVTVYGLFLSSTHHVKLLQ